MPGPSDGATERRQIGASPPSAKENALELTYLQSDMSEVKSLVRSLLKRTKNADVSTLSDELLEAYMVLIEMLGIFSVEIFHALGEGGYTRLNE